MKYTLTLLILISINITTLSQSFNFDKSTISDSLAIEKAMKELAQSYIDYTQSTALELGLRDQFQLEILAGQYEASIKTIKNQRKPSESRQGHAANIQYELFAKAKNAQTNSNKSFQGIYRSLFREYLSQCNDTKASMATISFTTYDAVAQFTDSFKDNYQSISNPTLTADETLGLLRTYFLYYVYSSTEPIIFEEADRDENRRYLIQEELIVSDIDGAELSVIIVRKRNIRKAQPAILIFTIYADNSNKNQAMIAASKGYVGVIATSRGKRKSSNAIEPYKHEHKDVYAVIDWISKQSWNNGEVGMYGGSYNGFTQWASMKESVHPALKTIVPSVSAAPGIDVPMENNVFHNFPYKWISYVTNNQYLDNNANFDRKRWNRLQNTWFETGKAYNKMDSIDGIPNPLFQEWISHPSYDSYWQSMIPHKEEFAHIDIPILSTTGYYDDGQRGAMYYYNEHLKYKPNAEHYLLIGPYDHWGAQFASRANLRGYEIDSVATINIREELVFDWFDYILKGKKKPEILKDKVNFQVMGKNTWLHASSLQAMNNDSLVYYLSDKKSDESYMLSDQSINKQASLELKIDLADRSTSNNTDYYPWPIIKDSINLHDGLVFKTSAFKEEKIINGSFSGELNITSNKKDFDFSVNIYERTPEGKYFHLTYYIGRASYAKSKEKRELLIPHKETIIAFDNTRIVSKKIAKGSQLIIIINGNKNSYSQINYGTGKDISTESIQDTNTPLILKLSTESKINIPLWNEDEELKKL
ncbi:CocE/NonD family hydrolase [Aureibacter tunicatorum]|uniref:Xaa-Pro dipeptidyl-peptidase C-terminal domain-containing protein n=1 Tax=Aureibacter tunicatorum TaxID=866807 RepID=A0AAE3XKX5_9BACT|nr:CocE/NonD family hydrolase [Aureibacter tunicatorum]MDR6238503.1 hypothetical protein [Aureibacter tunicatorum]BDD05564.1 hypothetical protein AUTU_30470 [Aureibacter tunicatorum]